MSQCQMDSEFLRDVQIIDYSLMVFKIDWLTYMKEKFKGASVRDYMHLHQNLEQGIFISDKEYGIYYHIGIIDYLQIYNFQKKLEKLGKQILNLSLNLDTSSQNPRIYSQRFINFVQKIAGWHKGPPKRSKSICKQKPEAESPKIRRSISNGELNLMASLQK